MPEIKRTNSNDPDFRQLVNLLDQELKVHNGDDDPFFVQYNTLNEIKHVVLAYKNGKPLGSGAFKAFDKESVEIKRMYVLNECRGEGIAKSILENLEIWAKELGYSFSILETGEMLTSAVHLYQNAGYGRIPNYEQYVGVATSVCMKKKL